jgi:hypothetical protein
VKKKKPGVLEDHRRHGSKFIPPLLQLGGIKTVRWQLPILPELLWLSLLNDAYGPKTGAELGLACAMLAAGLVKHKWFATTSSYLVLSGPQLRQLVQGLDSRHHGENLRKALNDLVWFYPECPLKFVFPSGPSRPRDEIKALGALKLSVGNLYDRTDVDPMIMQANAIYIAFISGMLKVAPGVSLAEFPEIEHYPRTETSRRVGSGVRAAINFFFGSEETPSTWPHYFWNRGLQLEPCAEADTDKTANEE